MTKFLLGLDQGGTKTAAVICDINGHILGTGYEMGLATVYFDDTEELFMKRIVSASEQACNEAGISLESVDTVCAGLNGADWDFEYHVLHDRLSRALSMTNAVVLNDCIAAMRGGSVKKECAVVCAGSGLNAAVCRGDGEQIIYGYYIDGSHQGASALGAATLRKAVEAPLKLCEETVLTDMILNHTGYDSTELLMIDITMDRYQIDNKQLAPLLIQAYASGDTESIEIINDFAQGIAKYITAAMECLSMSGKDIDLVFSGGVFKSEGVLVADKIFEIISLKEKNLKKVHARYEPVCGAALTLLDIEHNGKIPETILSTFDDGAIKHELLRN